MKYVPQVNWKHWWTASGIPFKSTCVTINFSWLCCRFHKSYKESYGLKVPAWCSTFLACIWLFEINTTTSQITITGFFWRYCDDFQQVNSRRWVVVRMSISYCFESGPESSSRSENFSLLKSSICLDGVQIANSSHISDRRFEYLRANSGGPFWK